MSYGGNRQGGHGYGGQNRKGSFRSGLGQRKTVIPEQWKKTTNKELIYGDFDHDGTPNLDDVRPFDPAVREQPEETKRTDQLLQIKRNNRRYRKAMQEVAIAEGGSSRIKSEWSTVAKLRRKYIQNIQDIAGVRILVNNTKEVFEKADEIKKKYKVLAEDDYYKNPLQGYYYAYHVTVEKDGFPVEIQIKTKGIEKLTKTTHRYYKQGKKGPIKKFRRLASEIVQKESS